MSKFNATNIRNLISENDDKWKELVPKKVVGLLLKFDGVNRIRKLNDSEKNK